MTTNPPTTTPALVHSAMLVQLNISMWTARKYDKSVSKQVEDAHQAKEAGRYNKLLVAKESLEAISKIANKARAYHYKMTLPWGDNGDRLLPAMLFMDYADAIRVLRSEFEVAVKIFVRDYPQLKTDARLRLGTMYEPRDYPDTMEIARRFEMKVDFDPVPTAGDFRVNLNEDYVSSIREDIEQRLQKRQREALQHCWDRLREVVGHIHERLADKDKTFRDTLISNAQELIALLPALNLTGDEQLNKAAEEVRQLLVDPDRLRQDQTLRSDTADKAAAILSKFGMKL